MCLESSSVERERSFHFFLWGAFEFTPRLRAALFPHQKSKGHDLEDALDREDDSESRVQVLEYCLVCRWGRVILETIRGFIG